MRGPGRPPVTDASAALDIEDFEFLLSCGKTPEQALHQMGIHARTMCRRYERFGRVVPEGMWQLAANRVKATYA